MAKEKIVVNSIEHALLLLKKQLPTMDLSNAVHIYEQLKVQVPSHPAVAEAKGAISDFLRFRFAEFISDTAAPSSHYESYFHGISKKIDITAEIPGFSENAKKILAEGRTLLFYDRLYTIYQSIKNTNLLGGDIFELGVYRGGSLKLIAMTCASLDVVPHIYGLDTFSGHEGVTENDFTQRPGQFGNTSLDDVSQYLAEYPSVKLIAGDARMTLPALLDKAEAVSFVHLDMDLYEPTIKALRLFSPKLLPGSIVLIDDYGFTSCAGVRKATEEFISQYNFQKFHLMTGQCLLLRRP